MRGIPLAVVAAVTALAAGLVPAGASGQGALAIPAPRGMLSDFASVVPADRANQIETIARYVRDRSGGEIAVVTLPDIAGADVGTVALRIGREWKVGANAAIGDARRNAGVVILLVPRETSSDGQGHISIQAGQGAEGFITDGIAGDIRREATDWFRRGDYSGGLLVATILVAERYATEFGFSLDSAGVEGLADRTGQSPARGVSPGFALLFFIVIVVLLSRGGRGGCLPFLLGHAIGSSRHRGGWGGHGGFGGGFGGGGGGAGFGGFGGGGGFSGGGSSGSF